MSDKNIKGIRTNVGVLKIDYDSLDNLPTIPSEANQISYTKGDITTVQEALDSLLDSDLKIESFLGGGVYEKGLKIETVDLTWSYNATVDKQYIKQDSGAWVELSPDIREYSLSSESITEDTVFYLKAQKDDFETLGSTSIIFELKNYWGVSENETLTNEEILAFNSELADTRDQEHAFDCSGGKYFYLAIPKGLCDGIKFTVGGLNFNAMEKEEISLTNAQGYVSAYNTYRPTYKQTGKSILVEVS